MPAWVGVVSAVSLVVIAVASLAAAAAVAVMALALRRLFQVVAQLAGPAVADVRQLVTTIKTEAEALVATAGDIRARIVRAADLAESRLDDLDALVEVVQGEVEDAVVGVGAVLRDVRFGMRLWRWTRALLDRERPKKGRRR
jgi:hypothetical protein